MRNFYISDTHFGHENIVRHDSNNGGRKFASIEEHDNLIIENWNKVVTPQDNVYILGDFSWLYARETEEIIKKLNGAKFLIKGNHDRWAKDGACKKLFQGIYDIKQIEDNGKQLILCHFPIMMYTGQHRGVYHLYGHTHNSLEEADYQEFINELDKRISVRDGDRYRSLHAYNVGCMLPYMDYTPRTLEEIIEANKTN